MQPFISPYSFAWNQPIWAIDANGEIKIIVTIITVEKGKPNKIHTFEVIEKTFEEEVLGVKYHDVNVTIAMEDAIVWGYNSLNTSSPAFILLGKESTGGDAITLSEEQWNANPIAGLLGDGVRLIASPITQALEAVGGRNLYSDNAKLNTPERIAKAFGAVTDLIALGKIKNLEGAFNWAKDKGKEWTINAAGEYFGWGDNEYYKFGSVVAQLIKAGKINGSDESLPEVMTTIFGAGKDLYEGFALIEKKYGIKLELLEEKDKKVERIMKENTEAIRLTPSDVQNCEGCSGNEYQIKQTEE